MSERFGEFETDVWTDGHPIWCHLRHNGSELRFSHKDLRDLEYAVKRMLRRAEDGLPANYKHEVAP